MDRPGRVLITGGASGLGAAVAAAVAKDGGTPLIIDRVPPGSDFEHVQADLSDRAAAERAVHCLARRADGLDAIVTAAGTDACGTLRDVPADTWEHVLSVNLLGTVSVVRAALPYLCASHGKVVTVASTLGVRALSDATAYCASKFGVVGFTRALAAELAGEVGVTLLIPGGMQTAFFDGRDEKYKPPADAALNDPANVAETILFALRQPPGCEVRELVVCPSRETSWP
ncbi:SDR family oxidoreductase [Bailinhaonella thermotolerans]|uniref:SDR family oxidoreductase n=1 Tax=Bailinhaonella thermotolerans TaxID=1070861 RepID=A0A3A4AX01_9ACTN|nr:SDR family oxidoreductase [Bailinhaonella thermotolerans]RJL34485.1 SDR family oxidoreductase [Bailinhaonella thermotolerans]